MVNPVALPYISPMSHPVILFDGVCNLCQGAVQFVIRRDRKALFRFASLQSPVAAELLGRELVGDPESIILVDGGQVYERSAAALRIARRLDGLWPVLYVLIIIPRPLRDAVYNWIARNRYRWFGRQATCLVPTAENAARFL